MNTRKAIYILITSAVMVSCEAMDPTRNNLNDPLSADYLTPPVGTFIIGNGVATKDISVKLFINVAGATKMRFGNTILEKNLSDWEIYSNERQWTLDGLTEGERTVYGAFSNTMGEVYSCEAIISFDNTPPSGSMQINNNDAVTGTREVTLNLNITDNVSMNKMCFSNDNSNWSPWEQHSTEKSWQLETGGGTKTVYGKFTDAAGYEFSTSDDIELDLTPPSGSFVINSNDLATKLMSVTLNINMTEAVSMRFGNSTVSRDMAEWEDYMTTKIWTVTSGDGEKTVYGEFKDAVGNITQTNDSIIYDTTPPTGTIAIDSGNDSTCIIPVVLAMSINDGTGSGLTHMKFGNSPTARDNATWGIYSATKTWRITGTSGINTVYGVFKDAAGNEYNAEDTILYRWTHPTGLSENISPDGQNATLPKTAMDDNGNILIVWHQSDGSHLQIYKSEYRNGSWVHPLNLTDNISPDGQDAQYPEVAMDNSGNAIITWFQSDGTSNQIYKSEYRIGSWSHPSGLADNISPDKLDAIYPSIALDNIGNAIITWHQSDGSYYQIYKSEYRSGSWTHPINSYDNISPDGQSAYYPHVALDDNGNAIITWHQSDGGSNQIYMSQYRSGCWTHPSNLADNISPGTSTSSKPKVAMSNNNSAVITWLQNDGTNLQIFKSEYRSGSWTHPSSLSDNISPNGSGVTNPQVAMDSNGNSIITWAQSDGSNSQIFLSEYRSGSWTHPSSTSDNISPNGQSTSSPNVAMDNNGNSIIIWYQNDGNNNQCFMSQYRNGFWTHPYDLSDNISPDGTQAYLAHTAMDNDGNAIIVWSQFDSSRYQIYKSECR